jgi:hypothetical protein
MVRTKDLVVTPQRRLDAVAHRVTAMVKVHDLLEEMAPELLRINSSAAETAALAMLRIRSNMDLVREDLGA